MASSSDHRRPVLKAANLPLAGVHIFRHSAAKLRRDAGESIEDVSRFLDHSSLAVTTVFASMRNIAKGEALVAAGVGKRDEAFPFMEHVMQTRADNIRADVAAAVAYLRSPEGGACDSVFTVGFCFGGANSWMQAAGEHGLSGVIGFYGQPGPGRDGSPGPLQRASKFQCPVLALMGGADQGIPVEQVDEFRATLQSAAVDHEIVVYPGAPHRFFDRSYEQHADAAADAWRRVLEFVRKYSRSA